MRWEKVKLGDCCEITSSKRIFYSEYAAFGIPFYRSKEIIERSQGKSISEPLYITNQRYDEIKCKFGTPVAGDMLLTSVGTIGIPYIVKATDKFYFKDGNLTWFRRFTNKLYPQYLFYWITSKEGVGVLNNVTIGSSQKALTISALKNIEVTLPPIETQRRIADILSAYDDLIENNRKQIKLLEEAAQRLYKEWFVDLRFPGHEHTRIVDGVPEGWKKEPLSAIADVTMGQSPKSEFYNHIGEGLPFHQGVGTYGTRFVKNETYTTSYTRIAEAGSILFSVRAPVGRLNLTENRIAIGRDIAALNHKSRFQSFLFYMLKERFFKDNLVGNGSIFASISKDELLKQQFMIPLKDIMEQYDEAARNIDDKISGASKQIELLIYARDCLLPKLMSGEVEA